jgi:hypothetical protein
LQYHLRQINNRQRVLDKLLLAKGEERSEREERDYQQRVRRMRALLSNEKSQCEKCWNLLRENGVPLINPQTRQRWPSFEAFLEQFKGARTAKCA